MGYQTSRQAKHGELNVSLQKFEVMSLQDCHVEGARLVLENPCMFRPKIKNFLASPVACIYIFAASTRLQTMRNSKVCEA